MQLIWDVISALRAENIRLPANRTRLAVLAFIFGVVTTVLMMAAEREIVAQESAAATDPDSKLAVEAEIVPTAARTSPHIDEGPTTKEA